jgi:hypothetical protein
MAHRPSLSFQKGRPIGVIRGGKYKKKILYIHDPDVHGKLRKKPVRKAKVAPRKKNKYITDNLQDDIPFDKMTLLNDIFYKHVKKGSGQLNFIEQEKVKHALKKKREPNDPKLRKVYNEVKEVLDEKHNKELTLHDGEILPIPNPDGRECLYIAGPSGSGKSTYIGKYAKAWKKLFPQGDVIVFSRVLEDKALDQLNPMRIEINDDLIENPIEPSELRDCLVIFDDTDTIPDKDLKEAINNLKDDLLETGRHENVYVVISSHLINKNKESRVVLNECHQIIVFPSSGSAYPIRYCLKQYFGLENADISKIMKLPSRWVCVHKNYPTSIMHSKGAYLLQ